MNLQAIEHATRASAEAEAQQIRRGADARAQQILAEARARGDALLAARRAAAERQAETSERRRLAVAHEQAREIVLRAERSVLTQATDAARAAARALVDDPRYASVLARLAADARERLAGAGPVQILTAADGGLTARAGSLQIDYSLSAQVERALHALASELRRLWL